MKKLLLLNMFLVIGLTNPGWSDYVPSFECLKDLPNKTGALFSDISKKQIFCLTLGITSLFGTQKVVKDRHQRHIKNSYGQLHNDIQKFIETGRIKHDDPNYLKIKQAKENSLKDLISELQSEKEELTLPSNKLLSNYYLTYQPKDTSNIYNIGAFLEVAKKSKELQYIQQSIELLETNNISFEMENPYSSLKKYYDVIELPHLGYLDENKKIAKYLIEIEGFIQKDKIDFQIKYKEKIKTEKRYRCKIVSSIIGTQQGNNPIEWKKQVIEQPVIEQPVIEQPIKNLAAIRTIAPVKKDKKPKRNITLSDSIAPVICYPFENATEQEKITEESNLILLEELSKDGPLPCEFFSLDPNRSKANIFHTSFHEHFQTATQLIDKKTSRAPFKLKSQTQELVYKSTEDLEIKALYEDDATNPTIKITARDLKNNNSIVGTYDLKTRNIFDWKKTITFDRTYANRLKI